MGRLASRRGDPEKARSHLEQALTLAREKGEPAEIAACLTAKGSLLVDLGDYGTAGKVLEEADQLAGTLPDIQLKALLSRARGWQAECQDDLDGARDFYQRSFKMFQESHNLAERPMALVHLGRVLVLLEEYKAAELASSLERNLSPTLLATCQAWAAGKSLEEAANIRPQ